MKLRIGSVVVLPGVVFIIPKSCVVRKVIFDGVLRHRLKVCRRSRFGPSCSQWMGVNVV